MNSPLQGHEPFRSILEIDAGWNRNVDVDRYRSGEPYVDCQGEPCKFGEYVGHRDHLPISEVYESLIDQIPHWSYQTRLWAHPHVAQPLKDILTTNVAATHPVLACRLYLKCADLTDSEDRMLLAAAVRAPQYDLPNMERVKNG